MTTTKEHPEGERTSEAPGERTSESDTERASHPPSDPPSKGNRRKEVTEKAKKAAVPTSIVGTLLTAVTAIYQANDTTIEKRTYDAMSASVVALQAQNQELQSRMSRFEQALLVAALNGHITPPSPPLPPPDNTPTIGQSIEALGSFQRPRRPRAGGSGYGSGRGGMSRQDDGLLKGVEDLETLTRDEVQMPDMAAVVAAVEAEGAAEAGDVPETASAVAEIIGRKIEIENGEAKLAPEQPAKKIHRVPNWNEISEF